MKLNYIIKMIGISFLLVILKNYEIDYRNNGEFFLRLSLYALTIYLIYLTGVERAKKNYKNLFDYESRLAKRKRWLKISLSIILGVIFFMMILLRI